MKTKSNIYKVANSMIIIYTLLWTMIFPAQTLAKPVPANSVFNKNKNVSEQNDESKMDKSFGNVPVYFEQNNGQFDKRVKYFARGTNGYSLFLTVTEAVYVLSDSSEFRVQSSEFRDKSRTLNSKPRTPNSATAVYMKLAGANENSASIGLEEMPHKTNYFKGKKENWRTDIPNFKQIRMENVYQGIDTVWHGKENGGVQYDFVVEPNANPNLIEWEIDGAESVKIDEKGDLLIKTEFGEIRQQKPFTYQENSDGLTAEIESRFVIQETKTKNHRSETKIGFEVGNYDRSRTLTIDPSVNLNNLAFSTYLGGIGRDNGFDIAIDQAGNSYVTGDTQSPSFPTTPGTFDPTIGGFQDVFVTKMNSIGTNLIYSTFIGGIGNESGLGIKVDPTGNAYITGSALSSPDFPTTAGALDETFNGMADVFVSKLNPTGSSLVYSTLIGGTENDLATDIDIDISGNAVITGVTEDGTLNYPTSSGSFDQTPNGARDVFVTKLNSNGSGVFYSTLIGGDGDDFSYGIALDSAGNAYLTGETIDSTIDYPTTSPSYDQTHNGSSDAFVTKINVTGSALVYSTFIGGSSTEAGNDIAVDAFGNAVITGFTNSGTFPTTSPTYDSTHNGGEDVFVTKVNSGGFDLIYSTFIGGSFDDEANAITLDSAGNAYITGKTQEHTTNYPTTTGAFRTAHNGFIDAFVSKLNTTGIILTYSSFIGGISIETGYGIGLDSSNNVLIAGTARDSTYPTTDEVFQPESNGDDDAFVSKFGDFSISGRTVDTSGLPIANTAVAMSGDNTGFMLSDASGYFQFSDTILGGTNLVSATQILYNFNPSNYEVTVNRNKQITFVGRPTTSGPTAAYASLGGNVESSVGNIGLANTKLTLIDAASGNVSVVHSDAKGDYEFEGLLTGTFLLVVPEKEGYDFNPGIYQVNHLQQDLGRDFVATPNAPRPVDDFDGDGKTDLAVYRPNEGTWYILESQTNNVRIIRFGLDGDIPVASDYDGDNRADIAVYRPSEGNWYRLNSSDGQFEAIHFGISEDKPVQADFDGDGKTDYAVYRPSTGVWHRLLSEDGSYQATQFGISTDVPIAADYDSDGKADLTVYRDGTWYHQMSADNSVSIYQFGLAEDKPLRGDFDGDGRSDTAVYRPSSGVWYWIESSDSDVQSKQFGISTDIPTPADYNGDGRYEQSVFRDGTWFVLRNDNSFYSSQFGSSGDIPIR